MTDHWEVRPCKDRLGNVTSYDLCLPQETGSNGVAVIASVYSGEKVANQIAALWNTRPNQEATPDAVEAIRGALSWIEMPFVTAETPADELRNRISFCLADAERALQSLAAMPVQEATRTVGDGAQMALEALDTCAKVFRRYGELHRAKGTIEGNLKASNNDDLAEFCEGVISDVAALTVKPDPEAVTRMELVEALEPFAKVADAFDYWCADAMPSFSYPEQSCDLKFALEDCPNAVGELHESDFATARALLTKATRP